MKRPNIFTTPFASRGGWGGGEITIRQVCAGSVRHRCNGLAINGGSRCDPPSACWEKAAVPANDPKSHWKKGPKSLIVIFLPPPGNDATRVSGMWEKDTLPSKTSCHHCCLSAFKRQKTTTNKPHPRISAYPGLVEPPATYSWIPYDCRQHHYLLADIATHTVHT